MQSIPLENLLTRVRQCQHCPDLPLGPRPVLRASASARILIVGQAPGARVHETGIPWNDPSGDRLRDWMGLEPDQFYNEKMIAIVPMGFCYPGRGKSGDLPPRSECAPLWHGPVLEHLNKLELILLVGQYAQNYYLGKQRGIKYSSLRECVADWQRIYTDEKTRGFLPLVHPSPRNRRWLQLNPWFEENLVPALKLKVAKLLEG